MQSSYQRRFVEACSRFAVPCRPYSGPAVRTAAGVYVPDYHIETNGMLCVVEAEKDWISEVSIKEACRVLKNFYIMTERNMALVELGRFAFVSLEDDLAIGRLLRRLNVALTVVEAQEQVNSARYQPGA